MSTPVQESDVRLICSEVYVTREYTCGGGGGCYDVCPGEGRYPGRRDEMSEII